MNCGVLCLSTLSGGPQKDGDGRFAAGERAPRPGGVSPGSCRARSAYEFDLNFLYEKLDTVYGKHSRNSGER
jgi:hypothetical protein